MVYFNGDLLPADAHFLNHNNRGLRYGDALFETLRVYEGSIVFWESHYLRLMASMRVLRMEIPMEFTLEFLEEAILKTVEANQSTSHARVRVTVFRKDGGLYPPTQRGVDVIIEALPLQDTPYAKVPVLKEVELFKDHFIAPGLLSSIKTNNRLPQVLAGIYASENGYDTCLLLNSDKEVVEAVSGNVFLVFGNTLKTPPVSSGCINGIFRKELLSFLRKEGSLEVVEEPVSPFELQKADELWVTNVISGIQAVELYRKKSFTHTTAAQVSQSFTGMLQQVG